MVLYDVKVSGLRSALNIREIAHLFRAGQLHSRTPCKPKGQAAWSTIGELFPLMQPGATTYLLPTDMSSGGRRIRRVLGAGVVLAVITIGTVLVRGKLSNSFPRDSATVSLQRVTGTLSLVNDKSPP